MSVIRRRDPGNFGAQALKWLALLALGLAAIGCDDQDRGRESVAVTVRAMAPR